MYYIYIMPFVGATACGRKFKLLGKPGRFTVQVHDGSGYLKPKAVSAADELTSLARIVGCDVEA